VSPEGKTGNAVGDDPGAFDVSGTLTPSGERDADEDDEEGPRRADIANANAIVSSLVLSWLSMTPVSFVNPAAVHDRRR
jgi:hypothetical protein